MSTALSIQQPAGDGGQGGRRRAEQAGRHAHDPGDRVRRVVHAGTRTRGARKNGVQQPTGTAAANSRLVRRSVAGDHNDHRLRPARVLVMVRVTTPWKRAWEGQRGLEMCESFQSAATGATAVLRLATVSRPEQSP